MKCTDKWINIEKLKKRGGIHAYILPRQSGKSTSLINTVGPGDLLVSPYPMSVFVDYILSVHGRRPEKHTSSRITYPDNKIFKFNSRHGGIRNIGFGMNFNNVYIDEFLFIDRKELDGFLWASAAFVKKNIIMLSSVNTYADSDHIFETPFDINRASGISNARPRPLHIDKRHYVI